MKMNIGMHLCRIVKILKKHCKKKLNHVKRRIRSQSLYLKERGALTLINFISINYLKVRDKQHIIV